MNVRLGEMTAADAIATANQSYKAAKATGDSAFAAADAANTGGSFDWSVFLANFLRPQTPVTIQAAPAAPSHTPYLVAGGVALLALLAFK